MEVVTDVGGGDERLDAVDEGGSVGVMMWRRRIRGGGGETRRDVVFGAVEMALAPRQEEGGIIMNDVV